MATSLIIKIPKFEETEVVCGQTIKYSTDKDKFTQCWALAPLLAPPCHWHKLKKVAHIAVALN